MTAKLIRTTVMSSTLWMQLAKAASAAENEPLLTVTHEDPNRRVRELEAEVERLQIEVTSLRARLEGGHTSKEMTHEMRTHLNGVIGMTAVLRTTSLSSKQEEYADAIWRCAQRLLVIVNDLAD